MRRAAVGLALLVAACAEEPPPDPLAAEEGATPLESSAPDAEPGTGPAASDPDAAAGAAARDPDPAAGTDVPHIYMALQEDRGGPTSVILAIDRSRDRTPFDDPAIRLTPEGGKCNPQQLRYYEFPPERTERPVYGPEEAGFGITARELPDYMATTVSNEMMAAGLARDLEDSRPQNVCTRKLLQRMMIDQSTGQG